MDVLWQKNVKTLSKTKKKTADLCFWKIIHEYIFKSWFVSETDKSELDYSFLLS